MLLQQATDKTLWERIRTAPEYAPARAQIEQFYHETEGEMPVLSFQDFMDFPRTGRRIEFERKYFIRRGQLVAAAGMYLIYRDASYLNRLEDVIWAICDEYTWSLPAHVPWDKDISCACTHIDLFAAETCFALSELSALLADALHPRVLRRVREEVEKRIICSFEQTHFPWESIENNWSAVCAGGVGAGFLYLFPERFAAVKPRLLSATEHFLQSYGSDGCCREGMSYWIYGFGFFTYFADLLLQFTNGEENLFADPRVQKAAQFQQHAFLNPSTVISFADCGPDSEVVPGLLSYLIRRYPSEVVAAGSLSDVLDLKDRCYRWPTFIRNLVWTDFQLLTPTVSSGYTYLPEAQWYINKSGAFSLAAKGGHNNEPHNHNDLGSFILADTEGQLLCDLGSGLYTHAYFQPETRYDIISNSAAGHSVPIIGGALQQAGRTHAAKCLRADASGFAVDIAGGYDVNGLQSAVREWQITNEAITLCDTFRFDAVSLAVTERFVTSIPPQIIDGIVHLRGLRMVTEGIPAIEQRTFLNHEGDEQIFYTIDYPVPSSNRFTIHFERG